MNIGACADPLLSLSHISLLHLTFTLLTIGSFTYNGLQARTSQHLVVILVYLNTKLLVVDVVSRPFDLVRQVAAHCYDFCSRCAGDKIVDVAFSHAAEAHDADFDSSVRHDGSGDAVVSGALFVDL